MTGADLVAYWLLACALWSLAAIVAARRKGRRVTRDFRRYGLLWRRVRR